MNQSEIILYQPDHSTVQLNVRYEDETVWLTQAQMVDLFDSTKQNISLHINNIFKEGELEQNSVVKYSLTTASDGKNYNTTFYNLDVIISVGYRVKSQRGTQFRIWAINVLKEYMLKGYALHHRIDKIEKKLLEHDNAIDLFIKTALPPQEGIFYDGQIFDAWVFVADIIKSAKQSIVLIDNYIDESTLSVFLKRGLNVKTTIYTNNINGQVRQDIARHNLQYPPIEMKQFSKSHDRFLIIDDETVYHIGASLKDLGKKWFAFSKINIDANEMLRKLD